jgi:delta1-piperideine-2-carboxylate reductase
MTVTLSLDEGQTLVARILETYGCSPRNAAVIAATVIAAERDGAASHGLFRIPGYVATLKSGWLDGKAVPKVRDVGPGLVAVDANTGFAQVALADGRDLVTAKARAQGIAAMAIRNSHHFAALWVDVEPFAAEGLVAMAFGNARSRVAPIGGRKKLFGTNPMAFACPRRNGPPMVWDQASSMMAHGEIQLAARHGHTLPKGAGYDAAGNPTRDPQAVLDGGALGSFGGHKGSAIALMVELMGAALTGGDFGFEDRSGPFVGAQSSNAGEFVVLIDPVRTGGDRFLDRTEELFRRLVSDNGARLPGDRRYANRARSLAQGLSIEKSVHDGLVALLEKKA